METSSEPQDPGVKNKQRAVAALALAALVQGLPSLDGECNAHQCPDIPFHAELQVKEHAEVSNSSMNMVGSRI